MTRLRVAIIIAFREFRDIEYFIPRDILSRAGARIATVSTEKGIAIGSDGGDAQVNLTAPQVKIDDFDAVVFIGGAGMAKKLDNQDFQRIAKEAAEKGKIVGAICIAPALLAKAGVLSGKKATVFSAPLDKSAIRILEKGGAEYTGEDVVIDAKVVTADGPGAARHFGEALLELLTKK